MFSNHCLVSKCLNNSFLCKVPNNSFSETWIHGSSEYIWRRQTDIDFWIAWKEEMSFDCYETGLISLHVERDLLEKDLISLTALW